LASRYTEESNPRSARNTLDTKANRPIIDLPEVCPCCNETALKCLLEGENCWPFTSIPTIRPSDLKYIATPICGNVVCNACLCGIEH